MNAVSAQPRLRNIALLLGLAWLVVVVQLLADHWAETAQTFPDMDDAMRLVEVRAFMDGRGWFDLHEMRLGPPEGYDTHWSRLIDAGIAGLILMFRAFADGALAERLARTIWPMLWLLPAMVGVAAIAGRLAGRAGAQVAFLCVALGLPAFQHFIPGRIGLRCDRDQFGRGRRCRDPQPRAFGHARGRRLAGARGQRVLLRPRRDRGVPCA